MPQIIIPILIKIAITVAVNFAVRAFTKKSKSDSGSPNATQTVQRRIQTNLPREILVGERIVGGVAAFDDSFGTKRENAVRVSIFSAYQCNSFEQLYMAGEPVTLAGDPTAGEVAVTSHFLGRNNAQRAFFRLYLGDNNAGLGAFLSGMFPASFSATDNFTGMCVGIMRCVNTDDDLDEEEGKNFIPFRGFPTFRVRLQGSPVCDPRLGHTYSNPASWTYSANAALIDEQHKYGWYDGANLIAGMGLPEDIMDLTQGALNADYCDTNSFECHGVIRSGSTSDANTIRDCYNGILVESQAKIYTVPEGLRSSEGTLDLSLHLGAKVVRYDAYGFSTEVYNQTQTTYVEPLESYTEKELPALTNATYLQEDSGVLRILKIDLPFVTDATQAAKIEKADLVTSRSQATCSIEGLPYALSGYSVGNTVRLEGSDIAAVNGRDWTIEALVETPEGLVGVSLRAFDPTAHDFGVGDVPTLDITPAREIPWSDYWSQPEFVPSVRVEAIENQNAVQDSNIANVSSVAGSNTGFSVSVSQSAVSAENANPNDTTDPIMVSTHGGVGPYTYDWQFVSGEAAILADAPAAATTTFTGPEGTATYKCVVTDSTTPTALVAEVTVTVLIFSNPF